MEANSNLFIRTVNNYTGNPTDASSVSYLQALSNTPALIQGFNSGGIGFDDAVLSLAIQPDGKILAGGDFTTYNSSAFGKIVRLNADGSIDATFNPGGAGFNGRVWAIAIQPDGKILVGGLFSDYNGVTYGSIVRMDSFGTIDPTFNFGGTGGLSTGGAFTIALQTDGKILVGGSFLTYNALPVQKSLIRLDTVGVLDPLFNPGGSGFDNYVKSIAIQSDGFILCGGAFTTYNGAAVSNYLIRLNNIGAVDPLFNPAGAGLNNISATLAIQSDGMILCGGNFTTYNGVAVQRSIIRLNTVGVLDPLFNPGGAGFDNDVNCIELQPDGTIYIGGFFTTYNGVPVSHHLVKLSDTGIADPYFNPGGSGFNGIAVYAIKITDGILAGGLFAKFNGSDVSYALTKLNLDSGGNNLLPLNFYGYNIINPGAADVFVKLYDALGAPAVGTDTPKWVIQVPKNGSVVLIGAEVVLNFRYGLWLAAVTGYQDSDNTAPATDLLAFIHYLKTN